MIIVDNRLNFHGSESQTFGSFALTLADDESAMLKLPVDFGHVMVAEASTGTHGLAWVRGSAAVKYFGGASFAVLTNTVLAGTTGTDGNLTISTNGGNFYIENRVGASINVCVTFFGIAANRM